MDEETTARLDAMFEDARAFCLARYNYPPEAYISPEARERHIDNDASATLAETRFAMPWNAGYARGLAAGLRQTQAQPTTPPSRPVADRMPCPGCGRPTTRDLIACKPCWRQVPGSMKDRLAGATPGTIGRARVVGEMRSWLKLNARDTP
jgi:hypothetical protein